MVSRKKKLSYGENPWNPHGNYVFKFWNKSSIKTIYVMNMIFYYHVNSKFKHKFVKKQVEGVVINSDVCYSALWLLNFPNLQNKASTRLSLFGMFLFLYWKLGHKFKKISFFELLVTCSKFLRVSILLEFSELFSISKVLKIQDVFMI